MLEVNAKIFYIAATAMAGTTQVLESYHGDRSNSDGTVSQKLVPEEIRQTYLVHAEALRRSCNALGTAVTLMAVERLIENLGSEEPIAFSQVSKGYREIISRFQDELGLTKVFSLNVKEQGYFAPKSPLFGSEFETNFPTAAFEVDEAAKCLAFGRSTASVFHLMRTLEIGIRSVAKCLGIPDPVKPTDRSWTNILRPIKDAIEQRWNAAARMSGDGSYFESVYASLDAVKNPWRNSTMHVEKTYTEDQAEHIFIVVRGFMNELASRTDENGEPKA
jgi:hypothetical protein